MQYANPAQFEAVTKVKSETAEVPKVKPERPVSVELTQKPTSKTLAVIPADFPVTKCPPATRSMVGLQGPKMRTSGAHQSRLPPKAPKKRKK